ncbi:cupin domain-containing protein [Paenibacillus caui]|uniref:cupin domain-containing protein n=1 Tax=Paenibacillus caui TaxID=2873927 RepID=UPI001F1EDCF8|nr:cupin domain-containing protein [Paenibacillus caui]
MQPAKMNIYEWTKGIHDYANVVVGEVNDHVVRAAVISGDFHWHKHEDCDELFLVLEGELFIDFEDQETVSLKPGDVYTVKANVLHRTRSNGRTVNLCFEKAENDINGD